MADRAEVLKEREIATKAWKAARTALCDDMTWPELAAYLDREHPLEPEVAVTPNGTEWRLDHWDGLWRAYNTLGAQRIAVLPGDRATVANLLCPFEEVVRAVMEESAADARGAAELVLRSHSGLTLSARPNQYTRDHLPAILSRLSRP